MSVFNDLVSRGIVSGPKYEVYMDKDKGKEVNDMQKDAAEVTTSGGIDTGISGFAPEDEDLDDQENDVKEGNYSESMKKLADACKMLGEVYESLEGKKLGELVCPQCSAKDQTGARSNYDGLDNRYTGPKNPRQDKFQDIQ